MNDTTSLRQSFRDDGVVMLKGALDREALAMALEAYEWSLAHPSRSATDYSQNPPVRFYQDLCNPKAQPAYRQLVEESPVADIVADLWGADDVWFMYEQVFLKEGGESRRTPWHQDLSYLPVEGERLAVMWISFEPIARENCLEFVPGSHRATLYNGSSFDPDDDTAPLYKDGRLPRLPNIESERDKWDIVSWAVEPGDVLIFHPAMLHGGAPTHAGGRRRTLSLRFFGDDAVYVKRSVFEDGDFRSGGKEVPVEGGNVFSLLGRSLTPGDPLRHPGFPKLRPRG